GVWDRGYQFGDWLDPAAPPSQPGLARTDSGLVATAYLYRSVRIVAEASEALEEDSLAMQYGAVADRLRRDFLRAYCSPAGRLVSHTQTAYTLALAFGLEESDEQRVRFSEHLVSLVRLTGYRLQTGFLGTPHL